MQIVPLCLGLSEWNATQENRIGTGVRHKQAGTTMSIILLIVKQKNERRTLQYAKAERFDLQVGGLWLHAVALKARVLWPNKCQCLRATQYELKTSMREVAATCGSKLAVLLAQ